MTRPTSPPHPGTPDLIDGAEAVLAVASAARAALDLDPAAGVEAPDDVLLLGRRQGASGAAAASGAALAGLRASHFARGEGVGALRTGLAAAAGRRLPWVLHAACSATTRHARTRAPGHDDLHALSDSGAFLMLARDAQQVLDLGLIAHRLAELSLVPGVVAHDDPLTTRALQEVHLPTHALATALLGRPSDAIETPTGAQRLIWGASRRTVPAAFDVDAPAGTGGPTGPEAWAQGAVAGQAFFGEPVEGLAERAFQEFAALTGRRHETVTAHRMQDAETVLVAQGGAVPLCEIVCDRLREEHQVKVGVVGVVMLRPFPSARLSSLLRGRRAVAVLERTLSPLGREPPLMQELRALMSQALENERATGDVPHAEVAPCSSEHLPLLASVTYGLGGAPLRSGQIVAAVENLAPGGPGRRRVVTGVEFERPDTHVPKLQIRQEQVLEACPEVAALGLPPAADVDVLPAGTVSLRVVSLGDGDVRDPARVLGRTLARLTGLHVRAWPDTAPPRLGLPTAGRVVLSPEHVSWPGDRPRLDALVVQDRGVLRQTHALAQVEPGGLVLVQSELAPEALWDGLPRDAQHTLRERALRLACIGLPDAAESASDQRTALQVLAGALLTSAELDVRAPLPPAVEHGARGVRVEQTAALIEGDSAPAGVPRQPPALLAPDAPEGPAHPGHFWEQVGFLHASGQTALVDPRAAAGSLPAASSTLRDMGLVRTHVPRLQTERCTACGDCWTQCPDAALRVRVAGPADLLQAAENAVSVGTDSSRLARIRKPLAQRVRRRLLADAGSTLQTALPAAYDEVADKLGLEPTARAELDSEFERASARLADFPLVRTRAFLEDAEEQAAGLGGLLSLTVDSRACKGCDLCVQICPEDALESVPQDEEALAALEQHSALHDLLPDTDERHLDGSLPRLFLRREVAEALHGGDGACAGCGEKTDLRLVLAAVHARVLPHVAARVRLLDELITDLDRKARGLVADDTDLAAAADAPDGALDVHVDDTHGATVRRLARLVRDLRTLRERLARGRAALGASAAGGCVTSFGGSWPHNPWSFPWTHTLVTDAPAQAVGLWEGHASNMAAEFALVRRARLERDDAFDPAEHGSLLEHLGWRDFDDEERALCPPVLVLGGDGALTLSGLSDLLAGDRPLKVVLLDNQLAAESGGASGATAYAGQRGAEVGGRSRLEPALLGLAHRGAFVLQGSPAAPGHLLDGLLRGLASPRPALFVLYAACPLEHGHAPRDAALAARLAIESRAFPLLLHDPDAPDGGAGALDLAGNPEPDAPRAHRELEAGRAQGGHRVPVTVADWAALDGRFAQHLQPADDAANGLPLHELLDRPRAEREGLTATIEVPDGRGGSRRMAVGPALVRLAEEREAFWLRLRRMAGADLPAHARERLEGEFSADFERRAAEQRKQHAADLADVKQRLPALVARRLAEGLLQHGNATRTVADLLEAAKRAPHLPELPLRTTSNGDAPVATATATVATAQAAPDGATPAPATGAPAEQPASAVEQPVPAADAFDEDLELDPSIDSVRCTTCDECTNINKRMFAYNEKKLAYIKDATAGTFAQLVKAAEKCPVRIIHPGTPLDPDEKNLEALRVRAAPFNT